MRIIGRRARSSRLAHTFSIVARDSASGQMGVAVQSHWFSVGSVVTWAEAGVGAVATQALVEVRYGPEGLDLMRAGRSAPEALQELLMADERPYLRQVALVDARGRAAVHTGRRCVADAGHVLGEGFSVQANDGQPRCVAGHGRCVPRLDRRSCRAAPVRLGGRTKSRW